MPVVIACASCNKKLRAADKLVGKSVKCPHCAEKVKVTNKSVSVSVSDETTVTPGVKVEKTLTMKASAPAAKSVPSAGKTTVAKKNPPAKTSPIAVTKPVPVKKKLVPVEAAVTSKPMPAPPRVEPKREAPKPKPAASHRYDHMDDDDNNPKRMKLLIAVAGVLAVIGLVVVYFVFFSGPSLGVVTGTVKFGDEPFDQADIVFIGVGEPKRGPFPSKTGKDGEYNLTGLTGPGLPLGKYKVVVNKVVMLDGKAPDGPEGEIARSNGWVRELVPPPYNNVEITLFEAVVKAGNNKFDFTIPK